jgi:integral membrane protein
MPINLTQQDYFHMSLKALRLIALLEGTTLILLVLVAMPLKYQFGLPIAVSIMGPIHGM